MALVYRPPGTNYSFEHHLKIADIGENEYIAGISYTRNLSGKVDLVCCATPSELHLAINQHGDKFKYLLWCDEPLWIGLQNIDLDILKQDYARIYGVEIFIITHLNSQLEWQWQSFLTSFYVRDILTKRPIATSNALYLGEYRTSECYQYSFHNCKSLCFERSKLALRLWTDSICDISGKGWSNHICFKSHSRDADWVLEKYKLLSGYSYNLCAENTLSPNYVTEKIWQSISAGCLPIYFFGDISHCSYLSQAINAVKEISLDLSSLTYSELKDQILSLSTKQYLKKISLAQDILSDMLCKRHSPTQIAYCVAHQIHQTIA